MMMMTKRFFFDLKCTKISSPAGGAYSAPPAVRRFGRGGKVERGEGGEEGKGRRREGENVSPVMKS